MSKIKAGDKVVVIAGKDKGTTGTVNTVLGKSKSVVVDGVNIVKKHKKADSRSEQSGGIIEKFAPLHISNVALLNPVTNKADRVGFKFIAVEGSIKPKKVRYFKSDGELVDRS